MRTSTTYPILAIVGLFLLTLLYLHHMGNERQRPPQVVVETATTVRTASPAVKPATALVSNDDSEAASSGTVEAGEGVVRGHIHVAGAAREAGRVVRLLPCAEDLPAGLATSRRTPGRRAATDASGRFTFEQVPDGRYLLASAAEDNVVLALVDVDATAAIPEHALAAVPARRVEGLVTDVAGKGISGAWVYPLPEDGSRWPTFPPTWLPARTSRDGSFFFGALSADVAQFLVVSPDAATALVAVPEEGVPLTVTMGPGAIVEGVVRDPAGKPIVNERVLAVETTMGLEFATAKTKPGGVFRFEGLRPGRYRLTLDSNKWCLPERAIVVEIPQREDLELSVTRAGQIRGRVVQAGTEAGVKGVSIIGILVDDNHFMRSVKTDLGGYFLLRGLPMGVYRISPQTPSPFRVVDGADAVVEVTSPRLAAGPVFALASGVGISGVVVDGEGAALADAGVYAAIDGGTAPTRDTRTDAEGRFELKGWEAHQRVRVWAEHGGKVSLGFGPVAVGESGQHKLRFEVSHAPVRVIAGVVANAQGQPIPGAVVWRYRPDVSLPEPVVAQSDEDGRFQFENCMPGAHRLVAGRDETLRAEQSTLTINVPPEEDVLDVELFVP